MNGLPIYNLQGDTEEKRILPKGIFNQNVSPSLLAQAVRVFLSNQRKAKAKTKTRGHVSKTTAKMYKQKGTGRARHGSYSAPIFVGGGISHGPTGNQNFQRKLSKPMTQKALLGALKQKADEGKLLIIKGANKTKSKTKVAAITLKKIVQNETEKVLLIVTPGQEDMKLSWRNLKNVEIKNTASMHPYFIIQAKCVLMTDEALEEFIKTYAS